MLAERKNGYNSQKYNLYKEGLAKAGKTVFTRRDLKFELGEVDKVSLKNSIQEFVCTLPKELLPQKHLKQVKDKIIMLLMEKLEKEKKKYPRILYEEIREYCEVQIEEILGFGAIQLYLDDEEVTDIIVNGPGKGNIFVEKNGRLTVVDEYYESSEKIMSIIEMIVGPVGRVIDESNPMVDARLPDGSRFNAIIPPLSLNGPGFSIRKFHRTIRIEDLVEKYKTLSWEVVEILKAFVAARFNIVAAGGTGSGKTTILNILSEFIPDDERIITIEDAAELKFKKPNLTRWETKKGNADGKGEVTIRQLVRNALRARPDRIVVGEVRGEETIDMLQAMNTGHSGSLTTVHANTPRDTVSRLETMVLLGGFELTSIAIRDQIASAIDVIIQVKRFKDGRRRLEAITLLEGIDGHRILLTKLMKYSHEEDKLIFTGKIPDLLKRLRNVDLDAHGIKLPEWLVEEAGLELLDFEEEEYEEPKGEE